MIKFFVFYKEEGESSLGEWSEYLYPIFITEDWLVAFRKSSGDINWYIDNSMSKDPIHWPEEEIINSREVNKKLKIKLLKYIFSEKWTYKIK